MMELNGCNMTIKFSFRKTAESDIQPFNDDFNITNDPELREAYKRKTESDRQRAEHLEKIKRRNAQVSEPFVALIPDATGDGYHYEFIHHSQPGWQGQDEGGNPKAKLAKAAFDDGVTSGRYIRRWVEPEEYGNIARSLQDNRETALAQGISKEKIESAIAKASKDEETLRFHAPSGMPVYEPYRGSSPSSTDRVIRRLFSSELLDRVINERSKKSSNTADEPSEDFFEILKRGGARGLMSYAMRGQKPSETLTEPGEIGSSSPEEPQIGICMECNRPAIDDNGNRTHVSDEEYSQLDPEQRSGLSLHRFVSSDLPDDRDEALRNSRIGTTSVLLGKNVKVKIIKRHEASATRRLFTPPSPLATCPICSGKGSGAREGKRDNNLECSGCKKDLITMKKVTDSEGNNVEIPYSKGLGGGKIKYFDIADVPDGDPRKVVIPGAPDTTLGAADCEHGCDNGIHTLTPKSVCSVCDGAGKIPNPRYVAMQENRLSIPVVDEVTQQFEGNPIVKHSISASNIERHPSSTHGYASSCNPDCATCHGDDDYQRNGKPCPNRIARFDEDDKIVSPPGVEWINRDGSFQIPRNELENILKESGIPYDMSQIGTSGEETLGSMYDRIVRPKSININKKTSPMSQLNKTVHDTIGEARPSELTGTMELALDIPESIKEHLRQERSRINSGPNASLTGSSQQLASVIKAVRENIGSFPLYVENKPSGSYDSGAEDTGLFGGRIDPDQLHPSIRQHVPAIEKAFGEAGGSDFDSLDQLYNSASDIFKKRGEKDKDVVNSKKGEGTYKQIYNRVLRHTDNHPAVQFALGNLPTPMNDRELGL